MKLSYRNQKNAEAISRIFNKPLDKPEWFKVQNSGSNGEPEILIYDYIGWPFNDPKDLIMALADMENVTARINSPGGDVFDGMAIYNALQAHKGNVTTRIEGLAASMASVIAMVGKKRQAYDNTMLMIHNAWAYTGGNQYDLRELADVLERIDGNILNVYHDKSKTGKRELADMMKAETWMTATEAKEKGFIDAIIDGKAAKAHFDLSVFANVPDGIEYQASRDATEREKEKALRDVGFSQKEAKAILAGRKDGENGGNQRDVESLKSTIQSLINTLGGK